MKRRPRIIVIICVCLLLGAIINVAVAAIALLRSPLQLQIVTEHQVTDVPLTIAKFPLVGPPSQLSDGSYVAMERNGLGVTETWYAAAERGSIFLIEENRAISSWTASELTAKQFNRLRASLDYLSRGAIITAGWPWRCFEGQFVSHFRGLPSIEPPPAPMPTPKVLYRHSIALPSSLEVLVADREHRIVPYRPIWPGFAINTLFYAAVLWLLWFAPGRIRRFIRIKRGRCPSCGYDLRGTTTGICPECGKANRNGETLQPSPASVD